MELHRYTITFEHEGERRTWEGVLDAHLGAQMTFTQFSKLNQAKVISGLRIRDHGRLRTDDVSLYKLLSELRR